MTTQDVSFIALQSLEAGLFAQDEVASIDRLAFWRSVMAPYGIALPEDYSQALIVLEIEAGLRKAQAT